jgi:methylthioribose-1-phosphate isomerase
MVCDTAIGALIGEKRIHLFVAGADRLVQKFALSIISSKLIQVTFGY